MKFPEKLKLPPKVHAARRERIQQLTWITAIGISARLFISCLELGAYYFFDSAALLLDALSGLFDIATSLFLLVSLRLATRPPDTNHPFGHGRFEPLAGLLIGFSLVGAGIALFYQQIQAPMAAESHFPAWLWLLPASAAFLLEICYQRMRWIAQEKGSAALAADANHFRTDGLSSLLAAGALIAGLFSPAMAHAFDHWGAIAISVLMVFLGLNALRENLRQLLDQKPESALFKRVRKAAESVEGVLGTEKIGIQNYGPDAHVDIDIELDPKLTVDKAHTISQHVRLAIQTEWPEVRDVTVHVEPYYPNDH